MDNMTFGSTYCTNCGSAIPAGSMSCPFCGAGSSGPSGGRKKKKGGSAALVVIVVILAVLLVAAIAAAGVFGAKCSGASSQIAQLKDEIADQDEQIEDLNGQIEALNDQIETKDAEISAGNSDLSALQSVSDAYSVKAGYWDDICTALSLGEMGGTKTFYVSKGIIYLTKGQTEYITLHTSQYGTAEIYAGTVYGTSAELNFTEDSWYGSETELTVSGLTKGVTLFEIDNSAGSSIIYILAIVN